MEKSALKTLFDYWGERTGPLEGLGVNKKMTRNIILAKDNLTWLSLDPAKTIFLVGAGVSSDTPSNLPLGNALTDAYLDMMLGDKAEQFILYWNNHIPTIRNCIKEGKWSAPVSSTQYSTADLKSGRAWERPRLEFIIGEMNKLDQEFQKIRFEGPQNRIRYSRQSSIEALAYFAEAEPNLLHYWLADFAKAGATVITANFDTCIEKALGAGNKPIVCDGVKGVETKAGFIYHFRGVATDSDIQNNLGATVNNISKRLPDGLICKLIKYFEMGYNIVFVGYSGLDFFDIHPFFEGLQTEVYQGKAIYLHFCTDDQKCEEAVRTDKYYEYLLSPFKERAVVYGTSTDFFNTIGKNSGVTCSNDADAISKVQGTAFEDTKRQLYKLVGGMNMEDAETFRFLNMFRLTSQLNINPSNFYLNWGEKIKDIYNDWKNDKDVLRQMFSTKGQINDCIVDDIRFNNWKSKNSAYLSASSDIKPYINKWDTGHKTELSNYMSWKRRGASRKQIDEFVDKTCEILKRGAFTALTPQEQDIERDTVHYLCGWQMKKVYAAWAIPVVRYVMFPKLRYLKEK